MDVTDVAADLAAEQAALDEVVGALTDQQWDTATPSPRWDVTDQIGHLTFFDNTAALAITDPAGFVAHTAEMMAALTDPAGGDEATLGPYRAMAPAERLAAWRDGRTNLAEAAASLANDTRVVWYGPSMGSKSFLTARLMETWAHGQDIVDAVGAARPASDRLRHIAQLGFITHKWSYINRGLDAPETHVQVVLTSPSGEQWHYGDTDATESISGSAEDFCLVVTQRRHVDDTDLVITTGAARDWMVQAQAFAGPATNGPVAGASS